MAFGSSWQTGHFASAIWKFLLAFALVGHALNFADGGRVDVPAKNTFDIKVARVTNDRFLELPIKLTTFFTSAFTYALS